MRRAAVALSLCLALLLLACSGGPPAAKKTPTRDELKALLVGKTKEEVRGIMGKPSGTFEVGDSQTWRYEDASRDPASGKTDSFLYVKFSGKTGRAEALDFSP